jgi:DNA-binding protein H-NS
MSSLKDLLAQQEALQKQIELLSREERSGAIAQVKALMAEHGLTVGDLGGKASTTAKKSGTKGAKVAAKYRDPESGNTWSGRGLQPKWLKAAIDGGKTLEDFAV